MSEPGDAPKIAFAPHLEPRVLDEERVLLRSEDRSYLLTGKLYVAAAPYLDGTRTREEIAAALHSTTAAPADRIDHAISILLSRRYALPVASGVEATRAAFWAELDGDPAGVENALRRTHVSVHPTGRSSAAGRAAADQLAALLAESGFASVADDDAADLTVVLVDDYLDPQLEVLNRTLREAGRRWIPLKADGRVTWLGPIFDPVEGPCGACLTKRLVENRSGEFRETGREPIARVPRGSLAPGRAMAFGVAALELARAVGGLTGAALAAPNLLTFDLKSLVLTRHLVQRQTACPVCGPPIEVSAEPRPLRLSPRRKHPLADGGSRTYPAQEVLPRLEVHVSPLTGLIAGLVNHSQVDGMPVYFARQIWAAPVGPRTNRLLGRPEFAAGKGSTDLQSRVSCLAEAVERYSGGWQGVEPRRRATLADLGEAAVPPHELMLFSDRQYADCEAWNAVQNDFNQIPIPFQPERAIDWTPMWSLSHERARWVPTQFCYYRYPGDPDHTFYWADSNGCASGSTLEEAILHGFLELVERDSCALWWYNRLRRPAVDLASFDDPFFRRTEAFLRGTGRTLYALDLTSDLGIPVVAALSHDAEGRRICCGLGAHLDAHIAASRAVAELGQMLALELEPLQIGGATADPVLSRWLEEATIEREPYVLPGSEACVTAADYPALETDDVLADIERCVAAVRRAGLEMLVLDTTRPEVGFPTVRVTVPGLRHCWARLAPGRLYDVPVRLGWLAHPLAESELNPLPFFL